MSVAVALRWAQIQFLVQHALGFLSRDPAAPEQTALSIYALSGEAAAPTWGEWAWLTASGWTGLAFAAPGLAVLCRRQPQLLLIVSPMLALGVGSCVLGARFSMYGNPIVWIGLSVAVDAVCSRIRHPLALSAASCVILCSTLTSSYRFLQDNAQAPWVSSQAERAMLAIADDSSRGRVWTDWDLGYPVRALSGHGSFADGARASPDVLAQLQAALSAAEPAELCAAVSAAGRTEHGPEYLLTTWHSLATMDWKVPSMSGSTGARRPVVGVTERVKVNGVTGERKLPDGRLEKVRRLIVFEENGVALNWSWPENAGRTIVVNRSRVSTLSLSEGAYASIQAQLLLHEDGGAFAGCLTRVWREAPEAAVWQLAPACCSTADLRED